MAFPSGGVCSGRRLGARRLDIGQDPDQDRVIGQLGGKRQRARHPAAQLRVVRKAVKHGTAMGAVGNMGLDGRAIR
ncbi:MAG: hypothetical protein ACLQVF_13505 [Isosphaeraceae bacterium]